MGQAWPIIEPAVPLKGGPHLDAVTEHLEAVAHRKISKLIVTLPPGTGKSNIAAVLFPAWAWVDHPDWRLMAASYGMDLSTRDSVRCRRVIESPWYQARWGARFQLTSDQDTKSWFENDRTGHRVATSVGGATHGKRATLLLCDDIQKADIMYASHDSRRQARVEFEGWWENVWVRALDPEPLGGMVAVAHRLTDDDGIAYLLGQGGWTHLMLPQEFDPARACVTAIGWRDWRTQPGELLFPELYPPELVGKLKRTPKAWYAQHQQDPRAFSGGGMYERGWFQIVPAAPAAARRLRYWDKAGTEGGGASTAGVLMAESNGVYYIEDVTRGQWGSVTRNAIIRQTAQLDGTGVAVRFEREGGSGGKESAEITVKDLAGYDVEEDLVSGSKEARGVAMAAQAKAGNVKLIEGPWNRDFLGELEGFPFGRYKDMADAAHGAFNKLALGGRPTFYFSGMTSMAPSSPSLRRVVLC